ncbi:YebF family protein [Pectobacterium cacticida]|uniref:YebF family protein n=1 Tax=Pectobacterium cacticida TaxID=69221 RepID=UPI0039866560
MGWKLKTALCILAVAAADLGYGYYRWHSGPTCDEITYEEAIENVRSDLVSYLIPRWKEFQMDRLGTAKPDIRFNKDNSYISEDVYSIDVTVSGQLEEHQMVAMLICRLGGIEYSAIL